jgi:hypothetical protein
VNGALPIRLWWDEPRLIRARVRNIELHWPHLTERAVAYNLRMAVAGRVKANAPRVALYAVSGMGLPCSPTCGQISAK